MFKRLFCKHFYQYVGEYEYGERKFDYYIGDYKYKKAYRFICADCGKEVDFHNKSRADVFKKGEELKRKHHIEKLNNANNKELQDEINNLKREVSNLKEELENSKVVINLSER